MRIRTTGGPMRTAVSRGGLVHPDSKTVQRIRTERRRDGDVRSITASRYQHPANTALVIPRVKHVPLPTQIGFEPGREVARWIRQWRADITQIPSTVAGRDVQGTAECDSRDTRRVCLHKLPKPFV